MDTIHDFTLPDGTKLLVRELTVGRLDEIAITAASANADDPVRAYTTQHTMELQASLAGLGGVKVSREVSGEELYHRLTPRQKRFLEVAYKEIHGVSEIEKAAFLASHKAPTP